MTASARLFGRTVDGRDVAAVRIAAGALMARVLTLGATLQDLRLASTPWPLTLGSDSLGAYNGPLRYAGAIVGPVANRIAGAQADIAGTPCHFPANQGPTLLHSGETGTHAQVWTLSGATPDSVTLTLDLPDGLGGFPGNRRLTACYSVLPPATLRLEITATTDKETLMNPAQHSYWTLDGRTTTAGHRLTVAADCYTPTGAGLLPTGEIADVTGTPFDLRGGAELSDRPLFDTNFCLADAPRALARAATLCGRSGTVLDLYTTAPGLQVYDGAALDSRPFPGLTGQPYGLFAGVALEPQLWPDAPHHPGFPPFLLNAGETYRQETQFRLSRRDPAH